ncbi:MAG: hypothetical protein ACI4P6_04505 [Candidatus Spyradosoma sp.]
MKYSKKILISLAFACFAAGTLSAAPAESLGATVRGANRGDADSQKRLAARYASGHEVVKDDVLAEQWNLRADPKLSAKIGGNALAALQRRRAADAPKPEPAQAETPAAKKPVPAKKAAPGVPAKPAAAASEASAPAKPETSEAEFRLLLRRASQGDSAALKKFREDSALRARLNNYAQTPEGRRNPFVDAVKRKIK